VNRRRGLTALLCGLTVLAGCASVTGRPLAVGTGGITTSPVSPTNTAADPQVPTTATSMAQQSASQPADPTDDTTDPGTGAESPPVPPQRTPSSTDDAATSPPGKLGGADTTSTSPAGTPVVGSDGAGDPYYPTSGNGGYEVDSYNVALTYNPSTNDLTATDTVAATVTAPGPLARFNLDLQPNLQVDAVQIDGTAARFTHDTAELVITPASALAPSSSVVVVITYHGQPGTVHGGTANIGDGGWTRTLDGGAVVAGEPYSASSWYPVNEHPSDTAAFSVTATVPDGWDVISNGLEVTSGLPQAPAGMHVSRWVQKEPIASYLTTIMIDKLTFTTDTYDGIPIVNAFTSAAVNIHDEDLAKNTPKILQVLSSHFGKFPFDAYGGIFTGQSLSFALETTTRPVYANWVGLDTMIHETAHQWYGDDVTIKQWQDICLNECFASYAPWLYHQDVDGANLDAKWKSEMAQVANNPQFWSSPLVDMGAGNEFTAVYDRGPLAVHALRHEMGETAFAELLKGWITTYGGKNASFDDFEDYASKLAGKDLSGFIDAWFRGTTVPPEPYRTPPGLG
jgi:aminopeptidase N